MEIFQFEQFRAIAECGTMSEAAKRLYLSQSTLSHNLKKLEAELGCQLFVRAHNRMQLTACGEVAYEYFKRISLLGDEMLVEIGAAHKREEDTVHIGSFSPNVTMLVLSGVAACYPDTMFEVVNAPTADLVDGLQEGRFDLVVATDIARKGDFAWHKLYEEVAFLSVPGSGGRDSYGKARSADLRDLTFVVESDLYGYTDWYEFILRNAGVPRAAITPMPFKEYLRTKDSLPDGNLTTSLIMGYTGMSESRRVVPIDEKYAHRSVGLMHRRDCPEKVTRLVRAIDRDADFILSGNAYTSFFLFPEDAGNFKVTSA